MAAANGAARVLVGQNGILSTPAASAVIRARKTDGGLILSASHNPPGADGDFGLKYNMPAGGPAPDSITDTIFARPREIRAYRLLDGGEVAISHLGPTKLPGMAVEGLEPVAIYDDMKR